MSESGEYLPRVRDFFAKRNILVTGGTGFMGMALIEGLLSASEEIGKIYVLVRAKRDMTPAQRITRVLSSEIFNHHSAESKAKVIPLVGDINCENFDFDEKTLITIRDEVSVFYHNAGVIKFNKSVKEAVLGNVLTTLRAVDLAKTLPKLSAFIYCSSLLSNSNRGGLIREEVYKTKKSPLEMIKLALEEPSSLEQVAEPMSDSIENHWNSYSYSKQLAENLIFEKMAGCPAGIVRPSLVYGFYNHFIPGWMGSSRSGHCGMFRTHMKGVIRSVIGNDDDLMWSIPCDYVIKALLSFTVSLGQPNSVFELPIIHLTNSRNCNPWNLKQFVTYINAESWKNPCDSYILLARFKVREGLRLNLVVLLSYLFVLMTYYPEKWFHWTPKWCRGVDIISIQYTFSKIYKTRVSILDDVSLENTNYLMQKMHPDDKDVYNFDVRNVDWRKLVAKSISWLRQYYYKDSNSVTWMHRVVQYLYLLNQHLGFEGVVHFGIFKMVQCLLITITSSTLLGTTFGLLAAAFAYWL
ncbi:hypothetical protein DMENIID0001_162880 [Sergentomyia squamirostris]